jgi:ABC-type polysaccharide/polyol phosphate transport system ATPase subunit
MTYSIFVDNVSKRYSLGEAHHGMLREAIMRHVGRLRKKEKSAVPEYKWALNGVSLQVNPGEVVGLIGRNGA